MYSWGALLAMSPDIRIDACLSVSLCAALLPISQYERPGIPT
jgi:hypothetical protein